MIIPPADLDVHIFLPALVGRRGKGGLGEFRRRLGGGTGPWGARLALALGREPLDRELWGNWRGERVAKRSTTLVTVLAVALFAAQGEAEIFVRG